MSDPRHQYFSTSLSAIFNVQPVELLPSLSKSSAVESFLNTPSVMLLCAYKDGVIHFTNSVVPATQNANAFYCIKKAEIILPTENISSSIILTNALDNPLHSLYLQLHMIYSPQLNALEPKFQAQLKQLENELYKAMIAGNNEKSTDSKASSSAANMEEISGINSLSDENNFWQNKLNSSNNSIQTLAQFAVEYTEKLAEKSNAINEKVATETVIQSLEDCFYSVNDLYINADKKNNYYPTIRLCNNFLLLQQQIFNYIRLIIANIPNLFESAQLNITKQTTQNSIALIQLFTQQKNQLINSIECADRYKRELVAIQTKNSSFAASYAHSDAEINTFQQRLQLILYYSGLHSEILRLLTPQQYSKYHIVECFSLFSSLSSVQNLLNFDNYHISQFNALQSQFNTKFSTLEQEFLVDLVLRRIQLLTNQPQLLLNEFKNYQFLILRPGINRKLQGEIKVLIETLQKQLNSMGEGSSKGQNSSSSTTVKNLTPFLINLLEIHSGKDKLQQMKSLVSNILGNNSQNTAESKEIEGFLGNCEEKIGRFDASARKLFNDWHAEQLQALKDKNSPLLLENSGKLMQLDTERGGELKVFYSEKLVILLREVRTASELGYRIDEKLQKAVLTADKYYRYAVKLQQVANFYNSMAEQILPSQLGMLLHEAQQFESVVRDQQTNLTWNQPDLIEKYMNKLTAAAENLTSRNRKLRSLHLNLANQLASLLQGDLLRGKDDFIENINKLRSVMQREERNNTAASMRIWKDHWDQQLYKLINFQYRVLLLNLNETLFSEAPTIDFCIIKRRLAFRPSLEDIKTNYYRQLKKFIELPKLIVGFNADNNVNIFAAIPERHSQAIYSLFQQSEWLFQQLSTLLSKYSDYSALISVADFDSLIAQRLNTTAEFEQNFRALKQRRKEAEKLPDSERIGPFYVNFLPFKGSLDDCMHRFTESLLVGLKKSSAQYIKAIESFITDSLKVLSTPPASIAELSSIKQAWSEINHNKNTYFSQLKQLEERDSLLKSMVSVSLDLNSLKSRWNEFDSVFSEFEKKLEQQKGSLREELQRQITQQKVKIEQFHSRWLSLKPSVDISDSKSSVGQQEAEKIQQEMLNWLEEMSRIKQSSVELVQQAQQFDISDAAQQFELLEKTEAEINQQQESWNFYTAYRTELDSMANENWLNFRVKISSFDDFCLNWSKKLKNKNSRDIVFNLLAGEIKLYKEIWPILRKVTGELFEKEHWKLLFSLLNMASIVNLSNLTLRNFLNAGPLLLSKHKEITNLAARAQGEVTIREAVEELKVWAEKTEFSSLPHASGIILIKDWKDLFTAVSDQTSLLSSLKESPYFAPFADLARQFEEKFGLLEYCLGKLNFIQRKWCYLQPIFSRGALPNEQARFKRIDNEFRGIMKEIEEQRTVLSLVNISNLREIVTAQAEQLERCQRALNDFLEEKRSKFPRFYFIGDDDLLEILGQASNPTVIQNHLKKLFAGIHSVEFSQDQKEIKAMVSSEKEIVPLLKSVRINEEVESWLSQLNGAMESTLVSLLVECLKVFDISRYPSQILNLAEMISFTNKVEKALSNPGAANSALNQIATELNQQLKQYTAVDSTENALQQSKLKALILDLIHNLDVIKQLEDGKVTSSDNWLWQKQLRFYLNAKSNRAIIRMCDAEFNYSYEYQGNVEKLVHTPLSDKCYLVLTQGMNLGYGGCPYGPAGTGKTESVKALGHAFGRQVLVFNCDEGIDFQSMGRIFTGIVKSGAWGCFDEFNRLKEDQLSAVSQQIQVIQAALKKRESSCTLLNQQIQVNFNAAIFVTMNPASREYGGRSKLPHNLKQLFRDVAMSAPDVGQIAEVILYAEGFQFARDCGRKVVETFELSRQLLSPQRHYDWGLRALKSILRHAGQLIHTEKKQANGAEISQQSEISIIIGALRVNTLSKLTFADAVRFNGLINDVFPNAAVEEVDYKQLETAIRASIEELKLELVEKQVRKVLQLYEALQQRMGVVIVGPSGAGKTKMLEILHHALTIKLASPVVRHVMNPKALERNKLLGYMDLDTREFSDGVLIAASRQVQREVAGTHTWIVCDGDIDPEWVESLNSVLDDNHLLTMPNGERIKFGSNVNFIFETHDLQFASPATVSRMGMIFLSEEDVDIPALVKAWLKRQEETLQPRLAGWIEELFYQALKFVLENSQAEIVARTKVGLVNTALSHLRTAQTKGEFLVALIRGMGSNLNIEAKAQLAKQIFGWAGERSSAANLLDVYYDPSSSSFVSYVPQGAEQNIPADELSMRKPPVVNTIDMQRNSAVIHPWLANNEPFILVGPEGAGKSLLLEYQISQLKSTSYSILNCSAQTAASHVLQKLNECCAVYSTAKGRVYRPKDGERFILFLKDLNLPKPDKYDTIQLIAFLQQLVTYRGFYDDNLDWTGIEKIQIVATMNPVTTVGRHVLSTRFTATVHIANITYPDREQLQQIYTCLLRSTLNQHPKLLDNSFKNEAHLKKLTQTLLEIYDKTKSKFHVDEQRHYIFNPRDLTAWVLGLLRYQLSKENILEILIYEANRLFADRLVNREQFKQFEALALQIFRNQWKFEPQLTGIYFTSLLASYGDLASGNSNTAEAKQIEESAEGSVSKEFGRQLDRVSAADFKEMVIEGLRTYEREYKQLNMLLFPEILDHLAFEDRILSKPGGSLLLVGDSGVGRRSSVTLLAHMHNISLFSPNVNLKYDSKAFRLDLRELIQKAAIQGERAILYLEDHQILHNSFLEDINSLLSGGEIPGLYNSNELDSILAPLKEEYSVSGINQHRTLYDYFISRIRNNLHIVLSMDNNNPSFLIRCESNPAIYTRCSCLWFGRWSKESLLQIPKLRLDSVFGTQLSTGQAVDQSKLLDCVVFIHNSCLSKGATPLKYCAFLSQYESLFSLKQNKLNQQKSHLTAGLSKLTEAASSVDILTREAEKKQGAVTKKQREADEALDLITKHMSKAGERKLETEQLQRSLGGEETKLNVKKTQIQNELKEVQPILDAAKAAVGGIKKDNINEIRSMRVPSQLINTVLQAVLSLMHQEDHSWSNMKTFLGKPNVKDEIINFDASQITPSIRERVNSIVKGNPDAFEDSKIRHASVAAAPLAAWVKAVVKYSAVAETVRPLQQSFEDASNQLTGARNRLIQCEQELKQIDVDVQDLKKKFSVLTRETEGLKAELSKTTEVLGAAQSLLGKLSGEKKRWETQVKSLSADLDSLIYLALLAAGFLTYLGGLDEDGRTELLAQWRQRCGLAEFNLQAFLSNESESLTWKAEGLPSDELSIQNGLIISNSVQTPFILDPNNSASAWLKTHLQASNLESVMQQDPRFVTQLELAVRFGKTLVISEVEGVLPILFPLLRKDLVRQGPRNVVQIGEKSIDYNDSFKLYLLTRNSNADLPSNATALVNSVNFTVTRSGLEGQLLGLTLNHEKPELEQKKSQLLAAEDKYKIQLADLEKSLLQELANSTGNILENKSLIDSLNKTKTHSNEILQSLTNSKQIQHDLDLQRETYRAIAKAGSILFFAVQQLVAVNNMYEFSLVSFTKLFKSNLTSSTENGEEKSEGRVSSLVSSLKLSVFNQITRSLFKADRLMFCLHLVHCLFPERSTAEEWSFFTDSLVVNDTQNSTILLPSWANKQSSAPFSLFSQAFPALVRQAQLANESLWARWLTDQRPEVNFPSISNEKALNSFQKLLIIKIFRPDRLQTAMNNYVCEAIGINSISPPPLSLSALTAEASPAEPILFICEGGADPTAELEEFAAKAVGAKNFTQIALGSGQTELALESLIRSSREGSWLLLKNTHLVTNWLPALEKQLKALQFHEKFRLFLTTESHPHYPAILLQQCTKISYEAPPGIKQNLLRTYNQWDSAYVQQGSVVRAQLLFILAWFHAVAQERRTYIPQGWSKFYEFSQADLRSAADILDNLYKKLGTLGESQQADNLPWSTIWGLLKFAIYGGRIDNEQDVRILVTYLRKFFHRDILSNNGAPGTRKLTQGLELPNSNKHADYLRVIQRLNDLDSPGLFSLPDNIQGSVQQAQAEGVIAQLKRLAVGSAVLSRFDREIWGQQLSPIINLWDSYISNKANNLLAKPQRLSKREEDYTPLEAFIVNENHKVFGIIGLLNHILKGLNGVIHHGEALTELIRSDAASLLSAQTPWRWAKHWYGPIDPIAWIREVVARKFQLTQWLQRVEATNNAIITSPLHLADFFSPRTFFNALRQQTARETNKPIDALKLVVSFSPELIQSKLKVSIEGLLLQGCGFEQGNLSPLKADSPGFLTLPLIYAAYIPNNDAEPYPEANTALSIPLYYNPTREEFITEFRLPCKGQLDRWILTGVALFLTDFK
jgi:dynein heavy chain 2